MGLSSGVIIELLDLLDNKCIGPPHYQVPTFELIWWKAQHILRNSDKPSIGKTLLYFIRQKYILKTDCQKLIAVFLLTLLFRDEPNSSLYLSSVARIIQGISYDNEVTSQRHAFYTDLPTFAVHVRNFLSLLLSPNAHMVMKYNPYDVLECRLMCPAYDLSDKLKLWDEALPHEMKCSIPLLIPVPLAPDPIGAVKKCVGHYDLASLLPLVVGDNAPAHKYYAPRMARLTPPSHFCLNEFAWFGFKDFSSVVCAYDNAFLDKATSDKARELVSTAVDNSLPPSKHNELEKLIRKNPKLAFSLGITPVNYPKLVESNPQIAITALSKMILAASITDYLTELVNMPLSLHSLEVVNVMTTGSVRLPEEFTNLYTSNCIVACEKMKDTPIRNRFVRLVGIFLQSLIRNNVINLQAMYIEIHSFCVEFRNFREAATLYRLIKTKERLENLDFGCDDDIFSEDGKKLFESKKKGGRRGRANRKKILEIKGKEVAEKGSAKKDEASTSKALDNKDKASAPKISDDKNKASTSKVAENKNKTITLKTVDNKDEGSALKISDDKNKASTSKVADKKSKTSMAKTVDKKEKDGQKIVEIKQGESKVKATENKENAKKVPENKKKVPGNKEKGNNANGNKAGGNDTNGNDNKAIGSDVIGGNKVNQNNANGNKVSGVNSNGNKMNENNANGNKVSGGNSNGNKASGSSANGSKVTENNGNKANGSNAKGNKVNGNNANGNKASGVVANGGSKVGGNKVNGNNAKGNNANGNKVGSGNANGNKANGSNGNNANGNKASGGNANGNTAIGGNANGNKASSGNSNGNMASSGNANGNKASGGNANGNKASGGNANGHKVIENNGNCNKASGSNGNGDKASGSNGNGDKATGSNGNGDKASGSNGNGDKASGSNGNGDKATGQNGAGNKKNKKKKNKK